MRTGMSVLSSSQEQGCGADRDAKHCLLAPAARVTNRPTVGFDMRAMLGLFADTQATYQFVHQISLFAPDRRQYQYHQWGAAGRLCLGLSLQHTALVLLRFQAVAPSAGHHFANQQTNRPEHS